MERPIIIVLKDDGKITKEMLEEAVKKAYEQGYEDGKKDSNWWTITTPAVTTQRWTYVKNNPTDITTSSYIPEYLG